MKQGDYPENTSHCAKDGDKRRILIVGKVPVGLLCNETHPRAGAVLYRGIVLMTKQQLLDWRIRKAKGLHSLGSFFLNK